MCCGCRMCMLCTCLILVVIAIGMIFGFGVYKHGFNKVKDTINVGYTTVPNHGGRRLFGFEGPPLF